MITSSNSHQIERNTATATRSSTHSSPEDLQPQIVVNNAMNGPSNESSNLSVNSDKEVDILFLNTSTKEKVGGGGTSIVEKGRKRKRLEFKNDVGTKIVDNQKHERKITDYAFKIKTTSPKRPIIATYPNGDSLSSDSINAHQTTPIHILSSPISNSNPKFGGGSSIYSGSDSNTSPPSTTTNLNFSKTEKSVQTIESGDLSDKLDEKKSKEIENLVRATTELKQVIEVQRIKVRASKETIRRLLVEQSRMERKQAKERVMEATLRIGQFRPARVGEHFKDQWIDGWAMEEINKKLQRINQERNDIVNATKNLKNRKSMKDSNKRQSLSSSSTSDLPCTSSNNVYSDDGFLKPELPPKEMTAQEYIEQEEIYRLRKEHLKKEETDLLTEKDRLERERNLHIREMKRVQCEEQSRFRDHLLLNDRYLLLSLLGKGGFSEVWRAFDLDENRYVACKIHQVNKDWKEDKKANYVKHAMREKDIHKSLDHPRIVRLFDLFTIDNDSFCTVLEYCDGNDLDFYLKQHKQIPEKEARCIIMQVVSALKYLSEQKYPIIHYDLKPANILLQSGTTSGEIKITDFGLYLPPETFTPFGDGGPPKISNKVDVWSVGVIFYQCIYGKRPFGHEKTQQQILEERTIFNAQEVVFPSKPPVTQSAQDFIRRCLQCRKEERADVSELIRHELFRPRGQKSQQPQSPSAKSGRFEQADCD
uniref:Protein kinase domain-containing protein n=1 Tax=Meloidogyne javanica TaxID=6303 RepID=A0A915N6Q4_MELJA